MYSILEPGTQVLPVGSTHCAHNVCRALAALQDADGKSETHRHQAVTLRGLRAVKLSSKSLHRDGETIGPLPRELKNERAAPANARKGFSMAHKSSSPPAPNAKFARETNEIH